MTCPQRSQKFIHMKNKRLLSFSALFLILPELRLHRPNY